MPVKLYPFGFTLLVLMSLISGCDRNAGSAGGNDSLQGRSADTSTGPAGSASAPSVDRATTNAAFIPEGPGQFVGSGSCGNCHRKQLKAWQGSHHDLSMQEAAGGAVLGQFDGSEFNYFGSVTRFYRKDGRFLVQTAGPEGKRQDYPIAYTFGAFPLQQYLVELPGGRLQALPFAWDSRDKAEGGQRWFHLYPDEEITPGDPLHWTGINQNWNFMCADCHSTNLQKNYDLASGTFSTEWSEIDVGCEACHGPGARHMEWAANPDSNIADKGLVASFAQRKQVAWEMDPESGIARAKLAGRGQGELKTCAQCHSRRSTAHPDARPGDSPLDHYNLSLLDEGLYHADGQVDDEVFVYGSFLQSRMHAAGVTCSNCHEPHSLELRAKGNAVCAQCHMPDRFDTAEHHFHPAGSPGAQCANCHMPAKNFMVVDARRDHSFRIPRPDLSDRLDTPNACTGCHTERDNSWATAVLEEKFGKPDGGHYGEAIHAGRQGLPGAADALAKLALDESQPSIARATAVSLLPRYLNRDTAQLLQVIAQQDDPLLELGLARALETVPEQVRPALGIPLLYSQQRVTRGLAANALAGMPLDRFPQSVQQQFALALNQYLQSETYNADRPESLANLANLHAQQQQAARAEALYRDAIELAPYYLPAHVNLSELYRLSGREDQAERVLRKALETNDRAAPLHHALGLSLIRQKKTRDAMEHLRRAAESTETIPRYIYVYGVALNSAGDTRAAIAALEQGLQKFPRDPQISSALASINRGSGERAGQ
nr:tetratricopeptide repeat protein [Microbulbifer zhoushanensis]